MELPGVCVFRSLEGGVDCQKDTICVSGEENLITERNGVEQNSYLIVFLVYQEAHISLEKSPAWNGK